MKKKFLKIIFNILAIFTKIYIFKTKPYVIGITGSVGKTSCRMIVYQILKKQIKDKNIYTSPKNFNSELGLIFSIFKIEKYSGGVANLIKLSFGIIFKSLFSFKKYDIILLEYGVDHPNDIDFLLNIVKPNISIFTKLDTIHIENFSSKDEIGEEKFKLINGTKDKTYLNYDDNFLRNKFNKIKINKGYFNNSNLKSKYIKDGNSIFSEIYFNDKIISTNILGNENFLYIELAYLLLKDFGINNVDGKEYLDLQNQPGRFNIFNGINNSILIDSTYNAGYESMKKMIENTRDLNVNIYKDYKLGFIIGDMRELGNFTKEEHEKLFKLFNKDDLLISVGKETKKYFPNNIKNFTSSKDAGIYLKSILKKTNYKYLLLFKGSQNTIFIEEALKQVLLNKDEQKKLVRQDKNWLEKK